MKKLVVILFVGLTMGLAACGGAAEPSSAVAVAPRTAVTLKATDIAYDNNRIEVVAGRPVKLTLHNNGVLEHDFSIIEIPHTGEVMVEEMGEHGADGHDEMGEHHETGGHDEMSDHDMGHMGLDPDVHVFAPTGGSQTIEFTPSTPGEYEFYCTVAGHKEAGMAGTLVVTAP
ncbi:MAG TPA: plastocyanin/azurin family copper-binding protein [Chloroflexota bacterium]|nr:plastocyanin/azurin family copper-binding protein [Chloroflexota bacterium]HUM71618.1 plastocyanin/azurin family copper-binding protein [Chloroflexota bacterium]